MQSIRSRLLPFACLVLVPLAIACEREPDVEPMPADMPPATMEDAAPPAELTTATDQYIAAWNNDDPAAVAPFFVDDATVTVNDDTFQGRDEVIAGWLEPSVGAVSNLQITEEIIERHGDDYRSAGTYTATIDPPDEDAFQASGRYTVTWTRGDDGQWRILTTEVHDDAPPES